MASAILLLQSDNGLGCGGRGRDGGEVGGGGTSTSVTKHSRLGRAAFSLPFDLSGNVMYGPSDSLSHF